MARAWTATPGGNWQPKLLAASQITVGFAAFLGVVSMATRRPILMLFFAAAQGLILVGVALFVVVAATAQRGTVREQYAAGDVIVRVGDRARYVYVIVSGSVEVVAPREGGGEDVKRLEPGDHFGEIALVGRAPHHASARAVTAAGVLKLAPSTFVALYTSLPAFREQFRDVLESRVRELERRV
jgi:hypothetical protein